MRCFFLFLLILLLIPCAASAEFSESSSVFDPELAQWALRNAELCGTPEMQEGLLKLEGYRLVGAYNYRRDDYQKHVVAYTVFEKPLDDGGTAVLISVRGTVGEEWRLNFDLMPSGDYSLGYAENFALAAEDVLDTHAAYLDALADPVFLVTGHSRGAAVANILGVRLSDRFGAENVFAYTFATPRTARGEYPAHDNIFNVINPTDIITYFPLPQWGFERYGVDVILPVDADDPDRLAAAKAAYRSRVDRSTPFSTVTGGRDAVMAAAESIAVLVPDPAEDFDRRHALTHPGAPEEGEESLSAVEFGLLLFMGEQGSQNTMARLTRAVNDFTPVLAAFQALTDENGNAAAWRMAHAAVVYGAWMTAAFS